MFEMLPSIILITGHYGAGKTNLAVNLALALTAAGRRTVLCDLDIVNPYFRSADFTELMREQGIDTVSPIFANTNLDVPALGPGVSAAIADPARTAVVDVGGDDAGAVALGRYAPEILARPYAMLYVYNHYRYLTREACEGCAVLRDIEAVSRLRHTHVVNNSNLAGETTEQTVLDSVPACRALCELAALPLLCTAAPRAVCGILPDELKPYPVDIHVQNPW